MRQRLIELLSDPQLPDHDQRQLARRKRLVKSFASARETPLRKCPPRPPTTPPTAAPARIDGGNRIPTRCGPSFSTAISPEAARAKDERLREVGITRSRHAALRPRLTPVSRDLRLARALEVSRPARRLGDHVPVTARRGPSEELRLIAIEPIVRQLRGSSSTLRPLGGPQSARPRQAAPVNSRR